jgi:hypothetical protein
VTTSSSISTDAGRAAQSRSPAARVARWFAGCVLAAALLGVAQVDVPSVTLGPKGDESTYVSMALSLAYDRDLKFTRTDLERFTGLYGSGPEGLFLKQGRRISINWSRGFPRIRTLPRAPEAGLDFGKALLHPLVAAPFVALFGLNGFLILNVLLLAGVAWLGVEYASAQGGRGAMIFGVAFVFASIVPIYAAWLTPEVLNFSLVFAAYFLWLYKHAPYADVRTSPRARWLLSPWTNLAAAFLLGAATYSKPPNALLIVPVAIDALWRRRLMLTVAVSITFLAGSAGLFGLTALVTGEWNYQGGIRRTFYGTFPFSDPRTTFPDLGTSMATNDTDADNVLAARVLWPMLGKNLVYFVVGRDAGLLPYFFPGLIAIGAWLAHPSRREPRRALSAAILLVSILVLLVLAPFSWGGGGGPPGNRYFLSLYPVLFFLAAPIGTATAVSAFVGGMLFVGPWLTTPFTASKFTWNAVDTAPLRLLPIELTMVDDLPVRLSDRARIPYGTNPEVLLYFMDTRASPPEGQGIWVQAKGTAEIIVRSEHPLTAVKLTWQSPVANHVSAGIAGHRADFDLQAGQRITTRLPMGPGVTYTRGSQAYVLRLRADRGFVPRLTDPASRDARLLGAFVELTFEE